MGGRGSGWYYRSFTRATVEGCRSIDIRRWSRDGFLAPGNAFGWVWRDDDGEKTASIGVSVHDESIEGDGSPTCVLLSYVMNRGTDDAEEISYRVPILWTACHLGGRRPWFRCPGIVRDRYCGRRAAILYLRSRYFLCRVCHNLAYATQNEDRWGRALLRTQRIRARLGGSASLAEDFPDKPKGMHWQTYERWYEEAEDAQIESWGGIIERYGHLTP